MKKMKKLLAGTLGMAMVFGLTACGGSKSYDAEINVYNWGDYIEDTHVIADFEKEYNIKVNYEMFDTNEDMYIKVKNHAADYDVIIPSDYMIEKMEKEGMLEELDFDNIPNYKYIGDDFKNLSYDPENKYSVPYMWGTVGILYNKSLMDEVPDSWSYLWDEKYKGQIYMLNSQRDSIAVALKYLGYSINTKDPQEIAEAEQALIDQKPLVQAYVGDEVKDQMIQGSAAMAVVWSGDAAYCMSNNPDLDYVIPKEGTNYWFDAMAIPTTCQNKEAAELFINYMCRTDVALANVEYIEYATPHTGAMEELGEEVTSDRRFYPTSEDMQNFELFYDLADSLSLYDEIWTRVTAN